MKFNLIKFKQFNLDKFTVSFTAHPNCIEEPLYQYENSGFGLRKFCRTTRLRSIPQYLNSGIYKKFDYDVGQRCTTNSEMFLLGHDIFFFDVDDPNNVSIVFEKLRRYSIPFTCVVNTGHDNRAHIIVVLENMIPYRSYKEKLFRKQLNKKLKTILTHFNKLLIDESALDNPVAFVRIPGAYRIDTGQFQVAVQGGTGQTVNTTKFINAVDRAYKRKERENRKVKVKNKGIYRKKRNQDHKEKKLFLRKIAEKPESILTLHSMLYKEIMQKMLNEQKPTYEALPFMVSHILKSNIPRYAHVDKLREMIAEYSDKGTNSRHLKNNRQLERSLMAGESHSLKKNNKKKHTNKVVILKDYDTNSSILAKGKKAISEYSEMKIENNSDVEKMHKLFEYIFYSYIQKQGIFSSEVMSRICGSNYKRYLALLEDIGLTKKISDRYLPGVFTKKYIVVDV